MQFDSSQAWNQAVASVSANRSVLWPVAGVFFLLPSLVFVWFFSDIQAQLMASLGNPGAASTFVAANLGKFLAFGLIAGLVQAVGNMSLLGLYADRAKPTVGEAIGNALRFLPTVIGAGILLFLAYFVIVLVFAMVLGGLAALLKMPALSALMALAVIGFVFWALTRLSMLLPVIVVEKIGNPVTAITRAWGLTAGNSGRLFLFYLLLLLAYVVVAIVVQLVLRALLGVGMVATGADMAPLSGPSLIAMGLVSGLIAMVVAVLLNAILAAVHRQLAGPSASAISETFS